MPTSNFSNEWVLLQNQFDSYEKYSLVIKLTSILIICSAYFTDRLDLFVFMVLVVLWFQDAIWKTFQSRIEDRLLKLEAYLADQNNLDANQSDTSQAQAYQFNREFLNNRPSSIGLVIEYLRQAFRPTVAFPHVFLLLGLGYCCLS